MDARVAIFMGSDSDLDTMQASFEVLKELGINYVAKITSAHRTPVETRQLVLDLEQQGIKIFIAAAGMAAHLAGAVAANTTKPVIGVPLSSGALQGFDSLLSTVQMPAGVPVATVAVGKAGAKNASFLAAQILAITDDEIAAKLINYRKQNVAAIKNKNQKMEQQLALMA